jgi:hypothetical protein
MKTESDPREAAIAGGFKAHALRGIKIIERA